MLKNIALALVTVASFAQASDIHLSRPRTEKLEITRVDREAEVVSVRHKRPFTTYVIELGVTVNPGSACTKIVGQKNTVERSGLLEVAVLGRTPNTPCIAVMPRPVDITVKFDFEVLTGGFVPANTIQKKIVQFHGIGLQEVTLNIDNKVVTVKPVGRRPR